MNLTTLNTMIPDAPTKKQQAIWDKGMALYDEFLEYLSYLHDPNAREIVRTPRTITLEMFVATKNRRDLNRLMLAEYLSNDSSPFVGATE